MFLALRDTPVDTTGAPDLRACTLGAAAVSAAEDATHLPDGSLAPIDTTGASVSDEVVWEGLPNHEATSHSIEVGRKVDSTRLNDSVASGH